MTKNGKALARFVADNFECLREIVELLNELKRDYLNQSQMMHFENVYEIPVESFIRHGLFRETQNGDFIFHNIKAREFISSCADEHSLSSPESVKKYYSSLNSIYVQLMDTDDINEKIRLCGDLTKELREFDSSLETNTSKLLREGLEIKENEKDFTFEERFKKVNNLLENYIIPLNSIIEDRQDTVLTIIRKINLYAKNQGEILDLNYKEVLMYLALVTDETKDSILFFARKIVGELFSLEKIRKSSLSVSGAIKWLENERRQKNIVPLEIGVAEAFNIYPADDIVDTVFLMEELIDEEAETTIDEIIIENNEKEYFIDINHFKEKIHKEGGFKDGLTFFYEELLSLNDGVLEEKIYYQFCKCVDILDLFELNYSESKKVLTFDGFGLEVPIIEINTKI